MSADPTIRAALRAACDAERAHDNASPCHACPEACANTSLAAAVAALLRALPDLSATQVNSGHPIGRVAVIPESLWEQLAAAVEEAARHDR